MDQHDALFALMEFGVGIAGFSGVAFAVIHRGRLAAVDRYRVTNILVFSLGAAFFAFVPVVIEEAGQTPARTWRITSTLLLAFYVAIAASNPRRMRTFTAEDRARLSRPFMLISWMLFLFLVPVLVANVAGWPFTPRSTPVLLGLLSLLLVSAGNFLRLLAPTGQRESAV